MARRWCFLGAIALLAGHAPAETITFDSFQAGTVIRDQLLPLGVRVEPIRWGEQLNTPQSPLSIPTIQSTYMMQMAIGNTQLSTPGNGLAFSPTRQNSNGAVRFRFVDPAHPEVPRTLTAVGATVFDVEESAKKEMTRMEVYDLHGALLTSIVLPWADESGGSDAVVWTGRGAAEVVFQLGATFDAVWMDNLTFTVDTLDCNGNGSGDVVDIAFGESADCDTDSIPDECEPQLNCATAACDINADGAIDLLDVNAFVAALVDRAFDPAHVQRSDLNADAVTDGEDISYFVQCLFETRR